MNMPRRSSPPVPAGTVYFVRHGLVHNPQRIAYGWLPRYRLAEEGVRQAEATAAFLDGRGVTTLLTSPLLRAVQTTRLLVERLAGVRVWRTRLLVESGLAHVWEGESWTDIPVKHATLWQQFQATPAEVEAGEAMAAMARRMTAAMSRALRLSAGAPAICVSHRDPILALHLSVAGRSFNELHTTACNPASVTVVTSNDGHLRLDGYFEPYNAHTSG